MRGLNRLIVRVATGFTKFLLWQFSQYILPELMFQSLSGKNAIRPLLTVINFRK